MVEQKIGLIFSNIDLLCDLLANIENTGLIRGWHA